MNCIGLILHQKIHPVFSRHANEKLLTIVQVFGHLRWPMLVVKASHLVHPWCVYSMSGQALHQTRASRKTLTLIVFCISIIWNQKTQNYYQGISFLCLESQFQGHFHSNIVVFKVDCWLNGVRSINVGTHWKTRTIISQLSQLLLLVVFYYKLELLSLYIFIRQDVYFQINFNTN